MNRWGSIAVTGFGGAMLLILASEINDAMSWSDRGAPKVEAAPDSDVHDSGAMVPTLPAASHASAILARPLFNWNRRPGQTSGVAADGPLPRLSGILVSATERYAIFAAPLGGKPQVVQEGSMIGRFTVDTIASDHVILKGGGDSKTLHTSFGVTPPPPMATPDAS